MPKQIEFPEKERRAETAYGASMGDPVSSGVMLLDGFASWFNRVPQPKPYTPWWRQWKFRFLVFAALGALLISGSKLL